MDLKTGTHVNVPLDSQRMPPQCSVLSFSKYLIICGGLDKMVECLMLDSEKPILYELPRMLVGRNKASLTILDYKPNQSLIVTGGVGSVMTHAKNECEKYEFKIQKWLQLPNMENKRFDHSSCTINFTFYVVGGYKESRKLEKSIEYLHFKSNVWQTVQISEQFMNNWIGKVVGLIPHQNEIILIGNFQNSGMHMAWGSFKETFVFEDNGTKKGKKLQVSQRLPMNDHYGIQPNRNSFTVFDHHLCYFNSAYMFKRFELERKHN